MVSARPGCISQCRERSATPAAKRSSRRCRAGCGGCAWACREEQTRSVTAGAAPGAVRTVPRECPPQSQTRAAPVMFLLLHVLFSRLPLPLLSLPLPSTSPFSSPFFLFCFFSFCSSCLSRAAARGDGGVGSSGRWAARRGARGSSPGGRPARGVRAGTRNHAPRAGGRGGAEPAPRRRLTRVPAVPGPAPLPCPAHAWAAARGPGAALPCPRGAGDTVCRLGWHCFPGAAGLLRAQRAVRDGRSAGSGKSGSACPSNAGQCGLVPRGDVPVPH